MYANGIAIEQVAKDQWEIIILWGCCGSVVGLHVGAFRPQSGRFETRSNRHVKTFGKSFTHSCLYCFGVLTPTQYQCYGRERFCMARAERSAIEINRPKYNTIQYNTITV